jgi:hypothetical protein
VPLIADRALSPSPDESDGQVGVWMTRAVHQAAFGDPNSTNVRLGRSLQQQQPV